MYKLRHYDETVAAVWDSLPAEAGEEFTQALADVCEDSFRLTRAIGDREDDVERTLTLRYTATVLLVINAPPVQRIYVRDIEYLD